MLQALRSRLQNPGTVYPRWPSREHPMDEAPPLRYKAPKELVYRNAQSIIIITGVDAEGHETPVAIAFVHGKHRLALFYLHELAEIE